MSKNTNLSFLTDYITADIVNGRIGINNPSPAVAFDIVGATKITGILTLTSTISNGTYTYTLPSATGTLALTSALSGYLPLTGGTLTGALIGTSASFSGNVGIGATVQTAWPSYTKVLQIGARTVIYDYVSSNSYFANNLYLNASGDITYLTTGTASLLELAGGGLKLYTVPSGTAGSAATITERLAITSAGNVIFTAPIRLKGYTVSTLPSGTQGDTAYVTDALAPTFMATAVGGGSIVSRVFFNGSTWTSQ